MNEMDLLYGMTAPGNVVVLLGVIALMGFLFSGLRVLSANRDLDTLVDQKLRSYPAAIVHIYKGAIVGLNSSGHARGLVAGDRCIGIAAEELDNTAGSAGGATLRVQTVGDFIHALTGVAVTSVGQPVYASADDTLTFTAGSNSYVGFVAGYDSTGYGVIRLDVVPSTMDKICVAKKLSVTSANSVTLIPAAMNTAGLIITQCRAIVAAQCAGGTEDQPTIAIKDSAGTATGITFGVADGSGDAVGDIITASGSKASLESGSDGGAGVVLSAGKGVVAACSAPVSGVGAAGSLIICVEAIPTPA